MQGTDSHDGGVSVAPLTGTEVRSTADYVQSWLAFRQGYLRLPGVQAALLHDDAMVLSTAHGHADVERDVTLTPEHLFRVASHSKTFTATAVMQLHEAGRLRLDDPLGRWLPDLAAASAPAADVSLRELLSHSAGLVRDGADADHWQLLRPFPDSDRLGDLGRAERVIPRNERFKYSNVGYALLGAVVEQASGTTYHDYLTEHVVDRLGLTRTGPELDPSRLDEYAVGYSALAYSGRRLPIAHMGTAAMAAATGFCSTAEDLCRYAAAHFLGDERLLSDDSKRMMQHEWWDVEGVEDGSYGLGFSVVKVGERRLVGHGGGYPGHSTRTMFDPVDRLALAVLTNAIDGPADGLARGVVKLVDLAGRTDEAEAHAPAPADADRFCARLANLWGVSDVARLGDRLFLLDPTADDPSAAVTRLSVVDERRLRMDNGPGYGSVGEEIEYDFDSSGAIVSVRGPSGLTAWPLEHFDVAGLLSGDSPTRATPADG
jgi:CubicO group peptidase (beta-lactamase class C family)